MDPISELLFSGDETNIELARQLARSQGLPEPPLYTDLLAAMDLFSLDDFTPTEDLGAFLKHIRTYGLDMRADVLSFKNDTGDFEELSWKALAPITEKISILENRDEDDFSGTYGFSNLAGLVAHLRDFKLERLSIDFSAISLAYLPEQWDLSRLRYFSMPITARRFPLARYAPQLQQLHISGICEIHHPHSLRELLAGFPQLHTLQLDFMGEASYPSWWAGSMKYGAFLVDAQAICSVLLAFPAIKTITIRAISNQTDHNDQPYRCTIPVLRALQAEGRAVTWSDNVVVGG